MGMTSDLQFARESSPPSDAVGVLPGMSTESLERAVDESHHDGLLQTDLAHVDVVCEAEQYEDDNEYLVPLPELEKLCDPLRYAKVRRIVGFADCTTTARKEVIGQVEDIEISEKSRERLYWIVYEDGDVEHLTSVEVQELQYTTELEMGASTNELCAGA